MRNQLLLSALCLFLAFGSHAQDLSGEYEVWATVKVDGLNGEQLNALAQDLSDEAIYSLDYHCLRSGIVVLHILGTQFNERGDVISLVSAKLQSAGVKGSVEFLDLHVEQVSSGKC